MRILIDGARILEPATGNARAGWVLVSDDRIDRVSEGPEALGHPRRGHDRRRRADAAAGSHRLPHARDRPSLRGSRSECRSRPCGPRHGQRGRRTRRGRSQRGHDHPRLRPPAPRDLRAPGGGRRGPHRRPAHERLGAGDHGDRRAWVVPRSPGRRGRRCTAGCPDRGEGRRRVDQGHGHRWHGDPGRRSYRRPADA